MKYDRQWPTYLPSAAMKGRGQGGFDHLAASSQEAVRWAAAKYSDAATQLQCLEATRWMPFRAQLGVEHLAEICQETGAIAEAVQEVLWLCAHHRANTTISRKEIRETTGYPAMPTMKAVSRILGFPYSLRGLTPDRVAQRDYGSRGKPVYRR